MAVDVVEVVAGSASHQCSEGVRAKSASERGVLGIKGEGAGAGPPHFHGPQLQPVQGGRNPAPVDLVAQLGGGHHRAGHLDDCYGRPVRLEGRVGIGMNDATDPHWSSGPS